MVLRGFRGVRCTRLYGANFDLSDNPLISMPAPVSASSLGTCVELIGRIRRKQRQQLGERRIPPVPAIYSGGPSRSRCPGSFTVPSPFT